MADKQDKPDTTYTFIAWLVGVAALGLLTIFVYASTLTATSLAALATIAGVAIAALMAGGLVGVLFGIPRRLQDSVAAAAADPAAPKEERSLYSANTNLEQISDWLTKIIIGVGLVEFGEIVKFLEGTGTLIATSLNQPGANTFAVAIIVIYVICGFMIGYLWARLDLGKAFDAAERVNKLQKELERTRHDAEVIGLVRAQLDDDAAHRPSAEALDAAVQAASPDTRRYIFYLAAGHREQNWRNRKGKMERAVPVLRALNKADIDEAYHRALGEVGFALIQQRKPNYEEAEKALDAAIERRGSAAEYGFYSYEANRALCRISRDPAFAGKTASDPETKEKIMSDLHIASEEPWTIWLKDHPAVKEWLAANTATWKSVETYAA